MNRKATRILFYISLITFFSCSSDEATELIPIAAEFSNDTSEILEDESITFLDNSSGNPTSWNWSFEGGNPSTSNEKNPTIAYENEGTYSVTLVASNGDTSDNLTKTNIITVNENLPDGLIARFLLDGNANDTSGNNVNGDISGTVTAANNRNNAEGSAMSFNEDMGYLEFGNVEEFEIGYQSSISISVWINPNGNQIDWDTVLNQFFGGGPSPSVNGRFYLGINPDNQKLRWNVFGYTLESSTVIPVSEWTHVVVNYENRVITMYINGVLDGIHEFNVLDGQRLLGTGAPFRIGKQSMTTSSVSGFNGEIDDINIFNRILWQNEISDLFENN